MSRPGELHHRLKPKEGDVAALARRFTVEVVPGNPTEVLQALAELLVAMWLRREGKPPEVTGA